MTRRLLIPSLTICLLAIAAESAVARKWTSGDGKFSIDAELAKNDGRTVQLKKNNGKIISVPIARLSRADQAYLKGLAAKAPTQSEQPSAKKQKNAARSQTVELAVRWKQGDKFHYEITKSRRKTKGGKVTLDSKATTPLTVEVDKASDKGYVLRWTMGETKMANPLAAINPLAKKLGNLIKDFTTLLEIDAEGTLVGVQNWQEVKKRATDAITIMTAQLEKSGSPPAQIKAIRAQTLSLFSTEQKILMPSTREAQMFMQPLGIVYDAAKPIEYDDLLPNPFGGEPFPCHSVFALESYDAASKLATISWKQSMDEKETTRIMQASLKKLAAAAGKPAPDGDVLPTMIITDSALFQVNAASGWPQHVKQTRTAHVGDQTQIDTVEIRRKPAAP
jgi:hypothetical protein